LLAQATVPSSIRTKQGVPRLIVAASNADFVDFADNFANSLLAWNVTNFVLVPLDTEAYRVLHLAYPEHTLPILPGLPTDVEGAAGFGSEAFKILTSSRPTFLLPFLKKGYAVLYNDIDMVWQHNAWDVIDDRDVNNDNNDVAVESMLWEDGRPNICTCLMYLSPTSSSVSLLNKWESEIHTKKHEHDQRAFALSARHLARPQRTPSGMVNTTRVFINDEQFPAGSGYSWNESTPSNEKAVIVHNNYIAGKEKKRARFETAGLWKPSGRLAAADLV
jgi:Nucleotide-diphospho-sugar transferase